MNTSSRKEKFPRLLIAVFLLIIALSSVPVGVATLQSSNALVVAYSNEPSTFDPNQLFDTGTWRWNYMMYETLIEAREDSTEFIPRLAESWEISDDGLQYTFALRQGVTFHDGTPFNADAVVFTIKRQTDANHPFHALGDFRLARLYLWAVADVVALDDHTVQFTLSEPIGPFLYWLTTGAGLIVSPTAVETYGQEFGNNPVGTGAFQFVEYLRGERLVLEANEDYWGDVPAIDRLIVLPITDPEGRLAALESGTAQFVLDISPDAVSLFADNSNYQIFQGFPGHIWYIALNQRSVAAFQDIRVRQALNYAVDKEAIVNDILQGSGNVAASPFSQTFSDWVPPDVQPYPYDPERARELLAEAGYENGFELTLIVPTGGFAMQNPVDMSLFIKSNLEAVGLTVNIETREFPAYYESFQQGNYEITPRAWYSNQSDPDNFLTNFFLASRQPPPEGQGGLNATYYTNPELETIINAQRSEPNQERRRELVHEAIRIIHEDAPWLFIDHMIDQHVGVANLQGIVLRGNGMIDFREATLE